MSFIVKYSYFLLLYPIFVLWYVVSQDSSEHFMPERLIFLHSLLFSFAYFIPFKFIKSAYLIIIYLLSLVVIFFEAGYVHLYKDELTSSVVFILLETNTSEASEYLQVYFTAPIVRLLLIFLIPSLFILFWVVRAIYRYPKSSYGDDFNRLRKLIFNLKKNTNQLKPNLAKRIYGYLSKHSIFFRRMISAVFFLLATLIYLNAGHFRHHILYELYDGYEQYQQEIKKYSDFLGNSEKSPFISSVLKDDNSQNKTLLIIIGESTTRHHMGIYGYYRNTTPNLKALGEHVLLFNDVISPHSHTIESLEKVLTFGSTASPEDKYKGTIIQLAQAAGYKTYWISNQSPIGLYETLLTMIAKTADLSYFTNMGSHTEKESYRKESYDEKLFPFIENALKDSEPKKIIFVHLYGTHALYSARYPKNFEIFKDNPRTDYPSERAIDAINTYDNAVAYNDYVVSHIINLLKQHSHKEDKNQLIYFSDHGEDVFQSMNFEGHTESVGSYPMFEIPFIYWTNQPKVLKAYSKYKNRSYMIDNFIYSVSDLLDIQFEGRDDTKSLFSPYYVPQERIVKRSIDYDKEIKP